MNQIKKWLFIPIAIMERVYHALRSGFLKSRFGEFGEQSTLADRVLVEWPANIHIGEGVSIGSGVQLWASAKGSITIGDRCAIAAGSRFITPTHDAAVLPVASVGLNRSIVLGEDVWIGVAAIILPGVTVHDGAIVAAGAVVDRDVPPDTVVGGVPAKVLRELEERQIRTQRSKTS